MMVSSLRQLGSWHHDRTRLVPPPIHSKRRHHESARVTRCHIERCMPPFSYSVANTPKADADPSLSMYAPNNGRVLRLYEQYPVVAGWRQLRQLHRQLSAPALVVGQSRGMHAHALKLHADGHRALTPSLVTKDIKPTKFKGHTYTLCHLGTLGRRLAAYTHPRFQVAELTG